MRTSAVTSCSVHVGEQRVQASQLTYPYAPSKAQPAGNDRMHSSHVHRTEPVACLENQSAHGLIAECGFFFLVREWLFGREVLCQPLGNCLCHP